MSVPTITFVQTLDEEGGRTDEVPACGGRPSVQARCHTPRAGRQWRSTGPRPGGIRGDRLRSRSASSTTPTAGGRCRCRSPLVPCRSANVRDASRGSRADPGAGMSQPASGARRRRNFSAISIWTTLPSCTTSRIVPNSLSHRRAPLGCFPAWTSLIRRTRGSPGTTRRCSRSTTCGC